MHLGDRPITTQPILANGLIYVGAWDGYEYALRPDGTIAWRQYLGRTKNCFIADAVSSNPQQGTVAGVVSTGAVATASVNGHSRSVLYIGGGGNRDESGANIDGSAQLIALDAVTGQILWRSPLGGAPNHLIWSSPAVYHDGVYVGVSSFDDCPLVQGKLVKVSALTGALEATFNAVPTGCEGASIWGSPTIDESAGKVYVATGNSRPCSIFGPQLGRYPHTKRGAIVLFLAFVAVLVAVFWPRGWIRLGFWLAAAGALATGVLGAYLLIGPTISINRPYSVSLIQLDAGDLHVTDSWKVPATDQGDYDFGSTPTLFSGTVTPGGSRRQLVGLPNKNGNYYVFDRAHIASGPVATIILAHAPRTDPTKGNGSIAHAVHRRRRQRSGWRTRSRQPPRVRSQRLLQTALENRRRGSRPGRGDDLIRRARDRQRGVHHRGVQFRRLGSLQRFGRQSEGGRDLRRRHHRQRPHLPG